MLRTLCAAAFFAVAFAGTIPGLPARSDSDTIVLKAQGNPNLVDFIALLGKRANLRVKMARSGLDAAFSDWLRRERPYVYAQYAEKKTER